MREEGRGGERREMGRSKVWVDGVCERYTRLLQCVLCIRRSLWESSAADKRAMEVLLVL
jgi:hypothetical protein